MRNTDGGEDVLIGAPNTRAFALYFQLEFDARGDGNEGTSVVQFDLAGRRSEPYRVELVPKKEDRCQHR